MTTAQALYFPCPFALEPPLYIHYDPCTYAVTPVHGLCCSSLDTTEHAVWLCDHAVVPCQVHGTALPIVQCWAVIASVTHPVLECLSWFVLVAMVAGLLKPAQVVSHADSDCMLGCCGGTVVLAVDLSNIAATIVLLILLCPSSIVYQQCTHHPAFSAELFQCAVVCSFDCLYRFLPVQGSAELDLRCAEQ